MAEEESGVTSWVNSLKEYNRVHGNGADSKSLSEGTTNTEEDKQLLEEYYIKFKGEKTDKYSLIPKFYSKVDG